MGHLAGRSELRFSGSEASLLSLYARNGRALLRCTWGCVSESSGDVYLRFRSREDRRDLLRGGMDAAFQRCADHSDGGDSAIAFGEYRTAWRGNSRAARPCFNPGIN